MPVMTDKNSDIDSILTAVPHFSRSPDGVVAIVKDGKLLGQRALGYANLKRRIPMTSKAVPHLLNFQADGMFSHGIAPGAAHTCHV
jgi:CubicO group peptidase (beta-lactamase class C family)